MRKLAAKVHAGWLLRLSFLLVCVMVADEKIAGALSFVAFVLFSAVLLVSRPQFVVKYLAVLFAIAFNVSGCAAIEFMDFYLVELNCQSGYVGALPLLIFSRWLLVEVLLLVDAAFGVDERVAKRDDEESVRARAIVWGNIAFIGLALISVLHVLAVGPEISTGVGRFRYLSDNLSGFWGFVFSFLRVGVVFPGLALCRDERQVGFFGLLINFILLFLVGCKFGEYFSAITIVLLACYPKVLSICVKNRVKVVFAIASVIAGAGIIATVAFAVYAPGASSLDFLFSRGAQQGQLWWRTYDLCEGQTHPLEVEDEIDAATAGKLAISENIGANNGIYKIMYYTTPQNVVDAKLANGSRYTEAGYASAYYYYGVAGTIAFSLVMGIAIAVVQNAIILTLFANRVIAAMVFCRISSLVAVVLSMFTVSQMLSTVSLVSYALLAWCWLMASAGWKPGVIGRSDLRRRHQLDGGRLTQRAQGLVL